MRPQEFKDMGGSFTLSDDSHGCGHVATNFHRALDGIASAGITVLSCLEPASDSTFSSDSRFPHVGWRKVTVAELEKLAFWNSG